MFFENGEQQVVCEQSQEREGRGGTELEREGEGERERRGGKGDGLRWEGGRDFYRDEKG